MDVELRSFQHDDRLLRQAARIYQIVWDRDPEDSIVFFRKYARFPHFRGYAAVVNGIVVGMAFGTASLPGQWWHDKVAEQVGEDHPALQQAWVLTELAVLEAWRSQGIGGILHDHILLDLPLRSALLSTQADNMGAQRFYTRRGWQYLHKGFSFYPGRPHYVIMLRWFDDEH